MNKHFWNIDVYVYGWLLVMRKKENEILDDTEQGLLNQRMRLKITRMVIDIRVKQRSC